MPAWADRELALCNGTIRLSAQGVKRIIGIAGGSGPAMGSSEGSEFGVEWRFQLPFFAGMSQRRFASPTQTSWDDCAVLFVSRATKAVDIVFRTHVSRVQ